MYQDAIQAGIRLCDSLRVWSSVANLERALENLKADTIKTSYDNSEEKDSGNITPGKQRKGLPRDPTRLQPKRKWRIGKAVKTRKTKSDHVAAVAGIQGRG